MMEALQMNNSIPEVAWQNEIIDPSKPVIVLFLGSNQDSTFSKDTPGLLDVAQKFRSEGYHVQVFETGSNPIDADQEFETRSGKYNEATLWFQQTYTGIQQTGEIIVIGYSWGAGMMHDVVAQAIVDNPNLVIRGSVSIDGVYLGGVLPQKICPPTSFNHLQIYQNQETLHGSTVWQIDGNTQYVNMLIEDSSHTQIDEDERVHQAINQFIIDLWK